MIVACIAAQVIDGDSIECRNLGQMRILGIDAPDRADSRRCRGDYGDHICDTAAATNAKDT